MNFSPIEVTLIASAVAAVTSVLSAFVSAHLVAKPAADKALTDRFAALIDRYEVERGHLSRKIEKLETVAADLEVMVIRMTEWGDDVVIIMSRRGIEHPPRPKFHEMPHS